MAEIIQRIRSVRWNQIILMMLIAAMVVGTESCKSTGKLTKKERKAQIEAAKKELTAIINGTTTKTLEQQEQYISDIAAKNFNDADLNALLVQATQKVKKAFAEKESLRQKQIDEAKADLYDMLQNKDNKNVEELEREFGQVKPKYKALNDAEVNDLIARVEKMIATMKNEGNVSLQTKLDFNFQGIVNASANGNLNQAAALIKSTLGLFASEDVPVLIIIAKEPGREPDYDEPTTIIRYLDYLKDVKNYNNRVESYQLDSAGKIKELDLIKK